MINFERNKIYLNDMQASEEVKEEMDKGFELLHRIDDKIITFLGSHTIDKHHKYYTDCEAVAYELGKRGYAIMSGGGPGIMKAANTGARNAGAKSIGIKASMIKQEDVINDIFTDQISFKFLFVRRFILSIKSEALIFYPGGYGTLDELFEYVVLMQTGLVDKVPIICVGKQFWQGMFDWLKDSPLKEGFFSNGAKDLELLHLVDTVDEILALIE